MHVVSFANSVTRLKRTNSICYTLQNLGIVLDESITILHEQINPRVPNFSEIPPQNLYTVEILRSPGDIHSSLGQIFSRPHWTDSSRRNPFRGILDFWDNSWGNPLSGVRA